MTHHPSLDVIGPPPEQFNLAAYVLQAGQQHPDKTALRVVGGHSEHCFTYAALTRDVTMTACALRARGLSQGARVLMRLGNTPAFPIVFLGAIYAGLIPIPTSAQLTRAEVDVIVNAIVPDLIVADEGIALPSGEWEIVAPSTLRKATSTIAPDMGDPQRPAYIVYTSGTSGKPRPVVHAHRAIWARRMMWDGWYDLRPDDIMLHAGAFNWTYTLGTGLMDPWAIGATALIPVDGLDSAALPDLMAAHHATIFAAAPGVYRRLLRADMPPCPKLRHGLSAGEKLPETIANRWTEKTGTEIYEAYGMSECSTFVSTRPGHVSAGLGWPQAGRDVALIGSDGHAASDDTGIIGVHRADPGLMLCYLDAPEETAARFAGDYFLTGDIGRRDADGAIHYEGRVDDMMNAGGYRVSPIEVENALASHPAITEVAACEIAVKADTRVIAAFYVSADVIDPSLLTAFASQTLAHYKVPREFVRVDALPRGANNKILRRHLRQNWETTHGQA